MLLTETTHSSPFNLTAPIHLGDLDRAQLAELARRHGLDWDDAALDRLGALVGGHPYLARLAMFHARLHNAPLERTFDEKRLDDGVFGDHLRRQAEWLRARPELLDAVRRLLADPAARIDPAASHRLHAAGLLSRETEAAGHRLRYRLYETYLRHLCVQS